MRLLVFCALLAGPAILLGPALAPARALLPADLLVQVEPWRSQLAAPPLAHWDALVWDGIAQYYPWRSFAAESLRSGRLPLWNPYQFCGTPFLANGQSAVLYPLNLVFLVLPVARAFALSTLLHLFLAGWFAYLLLRAMGASRLASVCGGVVWQLNSFFVAWLHLPTMVCTAAWLPLVLLFVERAITRGRARQALAAGLALALSYLGGHPQGFLFVALFSAAYALARGLSRYGPPLRRRVVRLVAVSTIAAITAFGLAAAQLLPTVDLLRIAHRALTPGPQGYAAFLSRALPAPMLSNLLLPHPFGHPSLGTYVGPENYAEYCCYVGIIALALAVFAVVAVPRWHARFLAAAAVLALLVAVGTPLNWPLYHWLPGMSGAGGPARFVLLAVFSLSMLAGLGADALFRALEAPRGRAPRALVVLILLVAAGVLVWWQAGGRSLVHAQPSAEALVSAEVLRAAALAGVALALLLAARFAPVRKLTGVCALFILAADLLLAARHHPHIVPQEWVYSEAANPGPFAGRILGNAADWPLDRVPRAVFPPNTATVYRLRDASGYDSLYLAQYRDFAALIQGEDPSPPANGNLLLARLGPSYGLDMLSLASVGMVVSPTPVRGLQLERAGAFDTYRNPYSLPRAWVAESAVFAPTRQQAVAAMVRLGTLPDCLVITGPDEPAPELPPGPPPLATVRDTSPNEVVVDLPRGGGGYLFLADSHAPGWHAYARGREVGIRAADVAFRAVALPPETRSVAFRYEPASFRVGLFLSLTALAGAALSMTFAIVVTLKRT